MRFYVPPKMIERYEDFLKTDVCQDIEWCHFFIPNDPKNVWVKERAEITRLNYKSKQFGADGSLSIRLSKHSQLKKGDMINWKGHYYLASWYVHDAVPDAQVTMMDICNVSGVFFRENQESEHIDHLTGEILEDVPRFKAITNEVYGFYMLNGNYEKRLKNSQAGLFNDNRTTIMIQANPDTIKIRRGDLFAWHDEVHQVDDISLTEVNHDNEGIMAIHMGLALNQEAMDFIDPTYHEDDAPFVR